MNPAAAGLLLQQVAQSVLEPAGPLAARTERFFWFATITATVIYLLTIGMLAYAATHRRRAHASLPPNDDGTAEARQEKERTMTRWVAGGVALSLGVLLVFLGWDFAIGRTLSPAPARSPLTIAVTGYQWWWHVEYPDSMPQRRVTTANEIHVPVGEPVVLLLSSRDVIHSIWVPNLGGKKDLVPKYTQSMWFQADTAGVYRGQCAEFCGNQHALMGLVVIAEPRAQFEAWLEKSRRPPPPPADPVAQQGERVFMSGGCVMCHNIEGTPAGSRAGPDLTGVGGRRTIAAATLANTPENMARWIRDPQGIKPGTRMPPAELSDEDMAALVAYLRGLK